MELTIVLLINFLTNVWKSFKKHLKIILNVCYLIEKEILVNPSTRLIVLK